MIYVGHTKFRWRGMSKVLRAIERVRDRVGRVALVGEGWAEPDGLDGAWETSSPTTMSTGST